jgi:hypothetical protein
MTIQSGFDRMQNEVNVDYEDLLEARRRRDVFRTALGTESDIMKVIPSGSLARGSHADPIHDVDLIVEFNSDFHPDWGLLGQSALDALNLLGGQVNRLMGATNGSHHQLIRLASPRNHAVKCFLDDPEDPDGFTVDVMPALRQPDGTLLVPETASSGWIRTNPELLIELIKNRHSGWNQFVKLIRVLKHWNQENGGIMKSLLVEVLALECLKEESHRGEAVAGYFTSANVRLGLPVEDPAGLCGPIQPDLDVGAARELMVDASRGAQKALDAERRGDNKVAMCHWHDLFGEVYPEPAGGCSSILAGGAALAGAGVVTSCSGPRRVRDAPQG